MNLVQIKFRRMFGLQKEVSCVGLKLSAGFSGEQRTVDLSTCVAIVCRFDDDGTRGACLQESSSRLSRSMQINFSTSCASLGSQRRQDWVWLW